MRISELLNLQAIDVNASVGSKAEAIDYMTRLMETGKPTKKACWPEKRKGRPASGKGLPFRMQSVMR